MLAEQRYEKILNLLEEKKSITVTEVKEMLQASESTVRRDITALSNAGKLVKVFGGAVAMEHHYTSHEPTVAQKIELNREEKQRIAKYAASLIGEEEFVYIDAGTTTGYMLDYITQMNTTFVTNAVAHAQKLAAMGAHVLLIGGELKSSTEAVIGNQAMQTLMNYHFTKGFFGTNGISKMEGLTTPDAGEALIKQTAMRQCQQSFVLCDYSKFNHVSSVSFAGMEDAVIITDRMVKGYGEFEHIVTV